MLTRGTETLIEQSLLYPGGFISPLEIEDAVTRALAEDLGRAGDVTSIATIPPGTPSRTVMVARKAGTIAGLPLAAACFRKLAPDIHTVFLMSSFAHIFVSSSILKDIASYGGKVSDLVPPAVARALKEKFR